VQAVRRSHLHCARTQLPGHRRSQLLPFDVLTRDLSLVLPLRVCRLLDQQQLLVLVPPAGAPDQQSNTGSQDEQQPRVRADQTNGRQSRNDPDNDSKARPGRMHLD
jgi:hypothetical protein